MAKRRRVGLGFRIRKRTRRVAGTLAAGTLGYIAGGSRGAALAGTTAWRGLGGSSRRFVPTGQSVGRHRVMAPAMTSRSTRRRSRRSFGKGDAQFSLSRAWTSRRRFRLPRGFKKMLGARYIRTLSGNRVELVDGGTQTVTEINLFTNELGTVVPYAMGFLDTELMASNLQIDAPAITPGLQTVKWKIQSLRIESRIKNMTNVPVQIRLYDLVARRDDTGFSQSPRAAWVAGLNNQSSVFGTNSVTFPGAEPYESRLFTQRYMIVKRTMFHLGAGSEHVHVIKGHPPWLNDRSISGQYTILGRRTRFLLMVVEGGVTDNNLPPGGEPVTSVNYSRHAVDVLTEYKVKFYGMEKSRTIYQNYSSLTNLTGAEFTITEDADESTPVVTA